MQEVYKLLDKEVIIENWPIVLLYYGTCLPVVVLMVFVIHTTSYIICDSMMSTR